MNIEHTCMDITTSIGGAGQIQGICLERISIEFINVNIQKTIIRNGNGVSVQRS